MSIKSSLDRVQYHLGSSRVASRIALKLRNQCDQILKYHITRGSHFELSGEKHLLELVAKHCSSFLDIGAHKGEWTALVQEVRGEATATERFILVEPQAECVAALQQRFQESNYSVHACAVGSQQAKLPLFASTENSQCTSLIQAGSATSKSGIVEVTTIDALLKKLKVDTVDFVKIDTEGYDLEVLKGALPQLQNHSLALVQFEYNAAWAEAGSTLAEAQSLLRSLGYEVGLITPRGIEHFPYEKLGEVFSYANFLAISPQMKSLVPLKNSELL